jgi:hypothetical protein
MEPSTRRLVRASEADRMHGGELKVNPLLRNIKPLEETAQGSVIRLALK